MSLKIDTFKNADHKLGWRPGNNAGGSTLFKALGHPKTAPLGHELATKLKSFARIAVYDPDPTPAAEQFDLFYGLAGPAIAGVFVQRIEDVGQRRLGVTTRAITELAAVDPDVLFIVAFDAEPYLNQIRRLVPAGVSVVTLDAMRLPANWLSNARTYLDSLNFATNFGFLRDADGLYTQVSGANYWSSYGAQDPALWLCLFGADGEVLAEWEETLPPAMSTFAIDSREVRKRFGLGPFVGSLFMHALRIKGHDVVKYVVDVRSEDGGRVSCTHDANAWPADLYAGIPAPDEGERLVVWIQNSHPIPIPAGAIGANLMGSQDVAWHPDPVPAFATRPVDLGRLLPTARWPAQIEIQAGRHFVRPRYEITNGSSRYAIAHANVERTDLAADPKIPELGPLMGKGYIMPLPVLPVDAFRTVTLPTPMSTGQRELPLKVALIDASGRTVAEKFLGRIARRDSVTLDIDAWLAESGERLESGYGHVEYLYDFRDGGEADGWLHALGRYQQRASNYRAETIFGAHIYNVPIVYRDEPQSYAHRPPGLTTRLFLRLADNGADTLCHLIYPASRPWAGLSTTTLILHDRNAREVATKTVGIACGGSLHWRASEMFGSDAIASAGPGAYATARDATCRLFGFHGIVNGSRSFCIDHMFGF